MVRNLLLGRRLINFNGHFRNFGLIANYLFNVEEIDIFWEMEKIIYIKLHLRSISENKLQIQNYFNHRIWYFSVI